MELNLTKKENIFISDIDLYLYQIVNFLNHHILDIYIENNGDYTIIYPSDNGKSIEINKIPLKKEDFYNFFIQVANNKKFYKEEDFFSYEDLKLSTDPSDKLGRDNRKTLREIVDNFSNMIGQVKKISINNEGVYFGYFIGKNYFEAAFLNNNQNKDKELFFNSLKTFFKVKKWQEEQLRQNKKISQTEYIVSKDNVKRRMLRELDMKISSWREYGKNTRKVAKDVFSEINKLLKDIPTKIQEKNKNIL